MSILEQMELIMILVLDGLLTGIIPKCIGFQLLFGFNNLGEIQNGPSENHVTGWYIRNLNIYKKIRLN